MGAQGRGLQVLTNDGEWIDAIAKDDEIVLMLNMSLDIQQQVKINHS